MALLEEPAIIFQNRITTLFLVTENDGISWQLIINVRLINKQSNTA
jgi:hypothetical protein